MNVCDDSVEHVQSLTYLGVYIDEQLNFKKIMKKCWIASVNLHVMQQIHNILTLEACQQIRPITGELQLDYNNALYCGVITVTLFLLLRSQTDITPRSLWQCYKCFETPLLASYKLKEQIQISMSSASVIQCFTAVAAVAPQYLQDLPSIYNNRHMIR